MTKLLSINADFKTKKGTKQGYLTGIIYMSPGKLSGKNLCPYASKGCLESCLYTAGRGIKISVKTARMNRTKLFIENRVTFFNVLIKEIKALELKAKRKGLIPVIRLNGTTDIPFELMSVNGMPNIMSLFPHIQFYDYTKNLHRFKRQLPNNYHLTFSRSESNQDQIELLPKWVNVAIVFKEILEGQKVFDRIVINGDNSDLRFLDPQGSIVGLTAKGKARKDSSGFVFTK